MAEKYFYKEGDRIAAQDASGNYVQFDTLAEFNMYYSGSVSFDDFYIDYKPDRTILYVRGIESFDALETTWSGAITDYDDIISDIVGMKSKLEDDYFGLDLAATQSLRTLMIKSLTYNTVSEYMPDWKVTRWRDYMRNYESVQIDPNSLNTLDQRIYDNFPESFQTNAEAYQDCKDAMNWILDCIDANDTKESEVSDATTIASAKGVTDPNYPAWPL